MHNLAITYGHCGFIVPVASKCGFDSEELALLDRLMYFRPGLQVFICEFDTTILENGYAVGFIALEVNYGIRPIKDRFRQEDAPVTPVRQSIRIRLSPCQQFLCLCILGVMVDLHTHSDASDGELSPNKLLSLAAAAGVTALALTDHDTMTGLMEAEGKAASLGIRFIPGIETEVDFEPGEFHLLGLNMSKYPDGPLEDFLKEIRMRRITRNEEMVLLMRNDNLEISLEELDILAGGEVTGRMHFARWLIDHGYARNVPDCFTRLLGPGCPYNVPKHRPSLEETLKAIHAADGKAVLAHPLSLWISWGRIAKYLPEWKEMGLDGIEAHHSGATPGEAARFEKLALGCGLFVTGGSDFHGTGRPDRRLGFGPGGKALPERLLKPFDEK